MANTDEATRVCVTEGCKNEKILAKQRCGTCYHRIKNVMRRQEVSFEEGAERCKDWYTSGKGPSPYPPRPSKKKKLASDEALVEALAEKIVKSVQDDEGREARKKRRHNGRAKQAREALARRHALAREEKASRAAKADPVPGPADPQALPAPVVKSYSECVLFMFHALVDIGSVDRAREAFNDAVALYRKARGE